jgi:hypothetical protein|tara:strand:+ start:510 stop:773 length:264 start_codon:yes stop_codon:yes gene_type:complete
MAITKEIEIAKIEVVGEYKHVQVRTDTIIKEDDKEISRSAHRHVLTPDEDISSQDDEVKAVCNAVWTDAVKAKWKTYQDSLPTPGSE